MDFQGQNSRSRWGPWKIFHEMRAHYRTLLIAPTLIQIPFHFFVTFFVTKSWFCWNFMNLLKLYQIDLFKCHWYLCWCIPQGINCSNMYHWWYFRAVIFTNWPLFNQNKLKITYFRSLFLIWKVLIRFNIYNCYVIITPMTCLKFKQILH